MRGQNDQVIKKSDVEDLKNAFPYASYLEIEGTAHNFTEENKRLYVFDQAYQFIKQSKS